MTRYVYPPRPKSKIKPDQLPFMESQGVYLWQPKFDGDRCVAALDDHKALLSNRHGRWHSPHTFPEIRSELLDLKVPNGTHYLDGELIKHQGQAVLVLFDVLQWVKYLTGKSQTERLEILDDLGGDPHESLPVNRISDHLWVSHHGLSNFCDRFSDFIKNPLLEGLMLRLASSTLSNWGSCEYEVDWQIRCRRPNKNYRF